MIVPVHVVQLHMKIGTADLAKHIKEIKVRAHVVLRLGYDLIRAGHAAYVEVKFLSHGDIYLVRQLFCLRSTLRRNLVRRFLFGATLKQSKKETQLNPP